VHGTGINTDKLSENWKKATTISQPSLRIEMEGDKDTGEPKCFAGQA